MTRPTSTTSADGVRYRIRLAGRLGPHAARWFAGLTVRDSPDGTTLVEGPLADQAALHGVLQRIRDLGLPLVAVARLDDAPDAPDHS